MKTICICLNAIEHGTSNSVRSEIFVKIVVSIWFTVVHHGSLCSQLATIAVVVVLVYKAFRQL